MNWEVILWTCLTLVVIMGVFGIIMSVISATNMKKRRENMKNLYEGLAIGNQVMFAGGIYGRVVGIEEYGAEEVGALDFAGQCQNRFIIDNGAGLGL